VHSGEALQENPGRGYNPAVQVVQAHKGGPNIRKDGQQIARKGDKAGIDTVFIFDVDDEKVNFNKKLLYKIAHETCQRCYRISSGYYEAIAQLRGDKQRIENLIAKITKYVQRRGGFIAKIESVENGKDVYLSDKLMTNTFFKDYDLKPARSFRLYGMKKGRKLYRNTYSIQFDKIEPKHNTFAK
jgi:NMD protein affecting ribosome stability and mRNA decay